MQWRKALHWVTGTVIWKCGSHFEKFFFGGWRLRLDLTDVNTATLSSAAQSSRKQVLQKVTELGLEDSCTKGHRGSGSSRSTSRYTL